MILSFSVKNSHLVIIQSQSDLGDLHLGVGLTMADGLLLALLSLVLEDGDLLGLAVLDDLSLDGCTLNNGRANLGVLAVQDSQNLLELHGSLSLSVQLLDVQDIALSNGVLLATGHDNCFHF